MTRRHQSHDFSAMLLILALALAPLAAQARASDFEPPRTSWGAPDISGLWDFRTLTPLERPSSLGDREYFTREEAEAFRKQTMAARDVDQRSGASQFDVEGAYNTFWWDWGDSLTEDLRTSLIVDPPNGRLPELTDEAKALARVPLWEREPPVRAIVSIGANSPRGPRFDGPEWLGLSERCIVGFNSGPPMYPSAYNNNVRILVTPDTVLLVNEMIHDARVVRLDVSEHAPESIRRIMGDSIGRWDGNTLVVETRNFTDMTPSFQPGAAGTVGTGESKLLIERFTLLAPGRLLYEYTLDDPATFTRPFTVAIPMRATDGPMYEYACHEGNYAMGGVLRGARLQEAEANAQSDDR